MHLPEETMIDERPVMQSCWYDEQTRSVVTLIQSTFPVKLDCPQMAAESVGKAITGRRTLGFFQEGDSQHPRNGWRDG